MLKINGNKKEFEFKLKNMIEQMDSFPDAKDADAIAKQLQQKIQKKLMLTILSISQSSTHFLVPNFPMDYSGYAEKRKKKMFDLSSILSFEYEFVDFADEFFSKKAKIEVENPNIIFFIPSSSKYIKDIELSIGETIKNNFLFIVKKDKSDWCLSILGYEVNNEMDCVKELPIIESNYFKVRIENSKAIVDSAAKTYRESIFSIFKNSMCIALNEDEEVYLSDQETFIPSSFLSRKDVEITPTKQSNRVKEQKLVLTSMSILYKESIHF